MDKDRNKKIVLCVLAALLLVVVARQYLPMVELPTESRLEQKLAELKSVRGDLGVAKKTLALRQEDARSMQELTGQFWIMGDGSAKLDQEVNSEFNRITRMAQITGVAGTQKVDLGREKTDSFLQDVTITADFRNISMQDFSRLLAQLRQPRNAGRFRWEYCKITPDNPRTPKALNISVRLKVLALNDEALAFLGYREPLPGNAPASASRAGGAAPAGLSRRK